MATPNSMTDLSVTAASNSPAGSESPTAGDDFLRAIQAIIRRTNAKGSDIASATTTDIGAATAEFVDITGTTTITGLGTIDAGIVRTVRFTGALTLTYSATSLILPSSANITTANGDMAIFRSLGSGNWVCVSYVRRDGTAISLPDNSVSTAKIADGAVTEPKLNAQVFDDLTAVTFNPLVDYVPIADGSDSGNKKKAFITGIGVGDSTETITDTGSNGTRTLVLDGVVKEVITSAARTSTIDGGVNLFPEFKCRAWVNFNGQGTVAIRASGNVSSITDNATGDYFVNFTTNMPDANYAVLATATGVVNQEQLGAGVSRNTAPTTSSVRISTGPTGGAANASAQTDPSTVSVAIFR